MFIALIITSCSLNKKDSLKSTDSTDYSEDEETNALKREFCIVDEVNETGFVLKNTSDILYSLDNSYLKQFKKGDKVLLLYNERGMLSDGKYHVDVYAIYPDDDTLDTPR